MINKFNLYHFVTPRPWPILRSFQVQSLIVRSIALIAKKCNKAWILLNLSIITLISASWWKNTVKEANKEGLHTKKIVNGIKIGILLFITSEVLFFTSFFWSYFHRGSRPNVEIGQRWPPKWVESFNPMNVPLLNTLILVRSGFSVTMAHHLILEKKLKKAKIIMLTTCLLGLYFTLLQKIEYEQAEFSITDSSYGTIFFMATGFHGIHVIIGTSFLIVNYIIIKKILIRSSHHIGFELSAWYWHFVDIVWLILYLSVYWWGK